MKFTVDRANWLRGEGPREPEPSALFRSTDHKLCCLGFRALACGHTKESITDVGMPSELYTYTKRNPVSITAWKGLVDWLGKERSYYTDTPTCSKIVSINDDDTISDDHRENLLLELFTEIGDEVEFV